MNVLILGSDPGTRTSSWETSLKITSCLPTNLSHGCFGQKPNVERLTLDSLATMIFQFLRFHGLWKPTTTWSTISGNLEHLLKLWNSRGDDNQVGFDHQSPLRNTITCSTKTERVIRTKSGGRIDKWASFPLKHSEWKYFLPGDSFRWVARRVLSHKLLGRCLHHEPVCQE